MCKIYIGGGILKVVRRIG